MDDQIKKIILPGLGEKLEKHSKNVRKQTRNLTLTQIRERLGRYVQQTGFAVGRSYPDEATVMRGTLHPSMNQPIAHELGHALMTPVGQTARQYTQRLAEDGDQPKENEWGERNDRPHEAARHEDMTNVMEAGIARRAGVAPESIQTPFTPNPHNNPRYTSLDEHDGVDVKRFHSELVDDAGRYLNRVDTGQVKFRRGRALPGASVDAKINARALGKSMDDKNKEQAQPPQWLGRPILSPEHHHDLETRAAMNEFHHRMPRAQAEQQAHDDYVLEHRERATAHHLAGMKAAQAVGNHEDARKHWMMYDLHMKALGKDAIGAVPPEIEKRMMEEGQKPIYKFKAHKGDLYALHAPSKDVAPAEGEPVAKAEAKQCKWRLGERRCKRMVTGGYCHDHKDHWANKIAQREDLEKGDVVDASPRFQQHRDEAHQKELSRLADLVQNTPTPPLPSKQPNETGKPCLRIHNEGNWTMCGGDTTKVPSEYLGEGAPSLRHLQSSLFCDHCVRELRDLHQMDQNQMQKAETLDSIRELLRELGSLAQRLIKNGDIKSLTPPPAAARAPAAPAAPQLHNTVEGFVAAFKGLPKEGAVRGKFLTQHMNHAPFLAALQKHPQGKQIHAMLTQQLNSVGNAGFKAGSTVAVAKREKKPT